MQETGPTVYSTYPRRPERLTICRYNYKGSTFSSVILRPWVLVRSGARTLDLPPMWPGFDSSLVSYVGWVCCLSSSCSEGFSPLLRFSPVYKNQHSKFKFIQDREPAENQRGLMWSDVLNNLLLEACPWAKHFKHLETPLDVVVALLDSLPCGMKMFSPPRQFPSRTSR